MNIAASAKLSRVPMYVVDARKIQPTEVSTAHLHRQW